MSTTLGIDIGTNSIGWCLVEDRKRVIDSGVRIFPVGVKEDDFAKTGSEKSKNAQRRDARHARRTYDRYRQRRHRLEKELQAIGFMFDKAVSVPAKELYGYRKLGLDGRLEREKFGRVLFLLNQRRGFKSNRKSPASDEDKGLVGQMNEFSQMLDEKGMRTPGEFFASLFDNQPDNWHNENEPRQRIRKEFRVRRELYENEFDLLWDEQSKYHKELTPVLKKRIKEQVIFYQRRLKSAKHLVGKCRFEVNKQVIPKSHELYQQFRVWQTVNNIRVTYGERVSDFLTHTERTDLASELLTREHMTHAQIKKFMGWPAKAELNQMPPKILGNTTRARIIKAVGDNWFSTLGNAEQEKLWHHIYRAEDDEWLIDQAEHKWGMTDEQIDGLLKVNLEADYGDVSRKAIMNMLPHLEDGLNYAEASAAAGYHHSFDIERQGKDRVVADRIDLAKQDPIRNPLVQMSVNETARLVNAISDKHGKPDRIRIEMLRSFKWPKKKREEHTYKVNEKKRQRDEFKEFLVGKKLLKDPRRSDLIKFELWLELEHSGKDLKKLAPELDLEDFKNFRKHVNVKDEEKFRLWLECDRISPYTGEPISLSKLFSEDIEVEHIIPFSRSLDNSFMNKTLSEAWFNEAKGNMTPLEYYADRPDELRAYKERVKVFHDGKREKLLAEGVDSEFKNSQLTNTAYIGKQVRDIMQTVCQDVRISNGTVTSLLRRHWSLNRLIWDGTGDKKNRDDHRHHAIDALVVACTTERVISDISQLSQETPYGDIRIPDMPLPWDTFRLDAAEQINFMMVSYKGGKRLLSAKKNPYRYSRAHMGKPEKKKRSVSVRGSLHEDTFYGQITHPETGKKVYVVNKGVESITAKNLKLVIDKGVRDSIEAHVELHGGKWAAALKETVYMKSKKGVKVPIKSVRIEVPAEEGSMIQLRPKENEKLFVKPGNNFCLAIYEHPETGKRKFETVSFFSAVKNATEKQPLFKLEKEGYPLLMTLQQKDMVLLYNEHPDEIDWNDKRDLWDRLYMVRKFDRNGALNIVKHNRTNVNVDRVKDYEPGATFKKTHGSLKAIKVEIDRLGQIKKA